MGWVYENKKTKAFANALYVSLMRRMRLNPDKGFPFVLYCEPTSFCNLRCPACPTGTGASTLVKTRRDLNEFKRFMDGVGDYLFTLFFYNWGEPLLHEQLPEMIDYANDKGILSYVSTNLSMELSDDYCRRLMESGLFRLKVGVDGATQEKHAAYRVGSKLERVKENLRRLIAIRNENGYGPKIDVRFHVFAHNEDEIDQCRQDVLEIGVDSFVAGGSDLPPDSEMPKDPAYWKHVETKRLLDELDGFDSVPPCSWLYNCAVVNPNWSVFPCCSAPSEDFSFGKVLPQSDMKSSFLKTWRDGSYRKARDLFGPGKTRGWLDTVIKDANDSNNGMCLSIAGSTSADELCKQCPTPYILDRFAGDLNRLHSIIWNRFVKYAKERDAKAPAFLLNASLLYLAKHINPALPKAR